MKFRLIFLVLCCSFTLNAEKLTLGLGIPRESPLYGYWEYLFQEVEERSNGKLQIELESMTLARSRQSLIAGTIDGDVGRTELVYENESNVVKIEPPLFSNKYYAFAKRELNFSTLEDIRQYRLATVRGNIILTRYIRDNNLDTIYVNENEDGLRMILFDRVDYLIATDLESPMLENEEFKDKGIIMHPKVLFEIGIHLFIAEKKQNLAPLLEKIILQMEKEERLKTILRGGE